MREMINSWQTKREEPVESINGKNTNMEIQEAGYPVTLGSGSAECLSSQGLFSQ
jgi:hypothetical protein